MQNIDGFPELGHVEYSVFALRMDPDLNDTGADGWNRLPIAGQTSRLNQAQLIADFAARRLGEPSQAVTTVSEPQDRLCTIARPVRLYRIFIKGSGLRT